MGPFDVDAGKHEPPALAVAHGGVRGALELVQVGDDPLQEVRRVGRERGLGGHTGRPQVEQVKPLPGLGGDLVANLAGVLAGAGPVTTTTEAESLRSRTSIAGGS